MIWQNSVPRAISLLESKASMKRKPDLLWVLVIILGLGVVTTGYTKSLWDRSSTGQETSSYEAQTILVPDTTADQ